MPHDFTKPPDPGCVYIDVTKGVEGSCLCIGNHVGGRRVAGPKPWGGGRAFHQFQVKISDIMEAVKQVEAAQLETRETES